MSAGAVLVVPACLSRYVACDQDLGHCRDASALAGASGLGDATTGGSATGGSADSAGGTPATDGGAGGSEDSGGGADFGAVFQGEGDLGKLGTACLEEGARACRGPASRYPLTCADGVWVSAGQCRWDERCASEGEAVGMCQLALPECLDREPGDWLCRDEQERVQCGPDLLDEADSETCDAGCRNGACRECVPEETGECQLNALRTCSEAASWTVVPCPTGVPHCAEGSCTVPPSCAELTMACGMGAASASCCSSVLVEGGTFYRENDLQRPGAISSFRLDVFEVTVARFQQFASAWAGGWRPDPGSGKHAHLNSGLGLRLASDGAAFESGWDPSWDNAVDLTEETRTNSDDPFATWSASGESQRPLNFVSFYEAQAFCIWDGGFLPSAGEWSYAASGGAAQRPFPWGEDLPGADAALAVHDCRFYPDETCEPARDIAAVGSVIAGIGLFGQLDLAGNLAERVQGGLEAAGSCDDCLELPAPPASAVDQVRGGAFDSNAAELANDVSPVPTYGRGTRSAQVGFRCARPP